MVPIKPGTKVSSSLTKTPGQKHKGFYLPLVLRLSYFQPLLAFGPSG